MPIQNDADLVKNSGLVGMSRLYDSRSLGLFKFEVADNIQLPADLTAFQSPRMPRIRENVPIVSTVGLTTTDLQRIWKSSRR